MVVLKKRTIKKIAWTVFGHAPFTREFILLVVLHVRRLLKRPHQAHYAALRLIDDDPRDLYLDVGACHGQSIESIRLYKPNPIISFEANPDVGSRLKQRYRDIEIHAYGLGSANGESVLYVPAYGAALYNARGSTRREVAEEFFDENPIYGLDPGRARIEELPCSIRTLDSLGLRPAFIKIDVEGTELDVIVGAMETIRTCLPIITVEVMVPGMMERLGPLGYKAYEYIDGRLIEGVARSGDTFLVPECRRGRIRDPQPRQAPGLSGLLAPFRPKSG